MPLPFAPTIASRSPWRSSSETGPTEKRRARPRRSSRRATTSPPRRTRPRSSWSRHGCQGFSTSSRRSSRRSACLTFERSACVARRSAPPVSRASLREDARRAWLCRSFFNDSNLERSPTILLVCRLVRAAGRLPRALVLVPRAGELAHVPRLALELHDAVDDALQERAVVRDDDDRRRRPRNEALEQREPVEVEVVRRLVEQEHVGVRVEDRAQRLARGLAARQPGRSRCCARYSTVRSRGRRLTPPRVRFLQPSEHPQQRRLAGAVRPDHADPCPRRDDQRDVVEDDVAAVALRDVVLRTTCRRAWRGPPGSQGREPGAI